MIFLLTLLKLLIAAANCHQRNGILAPCPTRQEERFNKTSFSVAVGVPEGCTGYRCKYFVGMHRDESDRNLVDFTLEGNASGWIAVGFSLTPTMHSADVFGCRRSVTGHIKIIDTWNLKSNVLKEAQDDMCYYNAEYKDGRLFCRFSRSIRGSSNDYDLDLNGFYYILLGRGTTPIQNTHNDREGFSYHQETPSISRYLVNPVMGYVIPSRPTLSQVEVMDSNRWAQTSKNECKHPFTSKTYRLSQRIPLNCVQSGCDFFMGVSDDTKDSSILHFTLEAKAKGWVAVGLSQTPNMLGADVFGCTVYESGIVATIDTWNSNSAKTNTLDNNQGDICQNMARIHDGRIHCKFSRSINGTSESQDFNLNGKYYLLFGTGDTPQSLNTGGFTYHEKPPTISTLKINPVEDSDLTVELAMIKGEKEECPEFIESDDSEHRISLSLPEGCKDSNMECDFYLGIDTNHEDNRYLDFTLHGKAGGWVAVGFSKTHDMLSANVLGCNVYGDGSVSAIDTWNPSSTKTNVLAYAQNTICQYSAHFEDGIISCRFSRLVKGSLNGQQVDLNSSYYLLLGTGNTPQESKIGGFTYHEKTPKITPTRVNPSKDTYDGTIPENANIEDKASCSEMIKNSSSYRIFQGFPKDCVPSSSECEYFLGINTNTKDNTFLDIALMGKTTGWIAVGFTKTPDMQKSDVLGCIVYTDGSTAAIDTWCPATRKTNVLDDDQEDIKNPFTLVEKGQLCCTFSRQINGTSNDQDLDLNGMHYLLFGSGQSPQRPEAEGGFTFHDKIPIISSRKINPYKDSNITQSLASVESTKQCPPFRSTSRFRISLGFPEGCVQSRNICDYFIGINTNSKNSSFLDFTLEGKANGWIAVGFSKSPSMDAADVVGCNRYSNETVIAIDTWNPESSLINVLDEPQSDICSSSVKYHNGRMYCTFSRSLKGAIPGRDFDLNDNYYLLFGTGDTPQANSGGFSYHEKTPIISKGMANVAEDRKVDGSQTISSYAQVALIKTHGILMIVAWPILAGLSIYFAAFMKPVLCKKGEWFQLHRGVMLSSLVLSSTSFVLIFVANIDQPIPGLIDVREPLPLVHFLFGVTIPAFQILNSILSLFRCNLKSKYRWIYNIIHGKAIGYATMVMAMVNIAVGIYLFQSGPSQMLTLFLFASSVGVVMYITLHVIYNVLPKICKQEKEPLISKEETADISSKSTQNTRYRFQLGILVLVHLSLGLLNMGVCIFLAVN